MDALADVFQPKNYGGVKQDMWVHPHEQGGHSPLYVRIIHLMRYEGHTMREIAKVMGVTSTAIYLVLKKPVCCPPNELVLMNNLPEILEVQHS